MVGLAWAALALPAWAQSDAEFRPGYRIVRVHLDDSRTQGSIGADLGWTVRWNDTLLVTPSMGFSLTRHHQLETYNGAWTVALRLAGATPVAPFLEFGVNAGEGLAEVLSDRAIEDRERDWVDTDAFGAAGFEFDTGRRWRGSIFYRANTRRGKGEEIMRGEGLGLGIIYRYPRIRLPWWKTPMKN